MRSKIAIFAAPALCLLMLGGVTLEKRRHTKPEDATPFHEKAKAALDQWPHEIGTEWVSRDWKIPEAAVQMLRPNATISRQYSSRLDSRKGADLLIVQCKDPIDMSGHYPPNCYPNAGERMVSDTPRVWPVGNGAGRVNITGMEYQFDGGGLGQPQRRCVYNFFVLPGRGIVPDMQEVRRATGDHQRRYFGAAQFQVVFPPGMPPETRDEIFTTLIGADTEVLRVLNPPGL